MVSIYYMDIIIWISLSNCHSTILQGSREGPFDHAPFFQDYRGYQFLLICFLDVVAVCCSPTGQLSLSIYLALGRKRAPNFSEEMREKVVWPIFERCA